MNPRLDAATAAMRAEIARQAADGGLAYRGVSREGLDRLDGRLDLARVAQAVLAALGEAGPHAPVHPPRGADVQALSVEADERQTERQAPDDASPGEAGGR